MQNTDTVQRLKELGIVPIVRTASAEAAVRSVEAIAEGGIPCAEITMTVAGAVRALEKVADKFGDKIILGAGTVLDPETARICMLAGAEFFVTPSLNVRTIDLVKRYSKAIFPGALTPTEIVTAWEAGADDSPRWDAWVRSTSWQRRRWTRSDRRLLAATVFSADGVAIDNAEFVVAPASFNAIAADAAITLAELTGDTEWRPPPRTGGNRIAVVDHHSGSVDASVPGTRRCALHRLLRRGAGHHDRLRRRGRPGDSQSLAAGGLFERLTIGAFEAWMLVIAVKVLRHPALLARRSPGT